MALKFVGIPEIIIVQQCNQVTRGKSHTLITRVICALSMRSRNNDSIIVYAKREGCAVRWASVIDDDNLVRAVSLSDHAVDRRGQPAMSERRDHHRYGR